MGDYNMLGTIYNVQLIEDSDNDDSKWLLRECLRLVNRVAKLELVYLKINTPTFGRVSVLTVAMLDTILEQYKELAYWLCEHADIITIDWGMFGTRWESWIKTRSYF